MELTKKELAELAWYSYRRLHDIDKGLPQGEKLFVKGDGDGYDLSLFVQRWVAYNVAKATKEAGDDLNTVKAAHEHVKMHKSELELRRMRGELIEAEAVKRLWADVATEVTQKLLAVPSALSQALVMMDSPEAIEQKVDDAIRDALTMIADVPMPKSDERYRTDIDE